jgi:hypothetical protein
MVEVDRRTLKPREWMDVFPAPPPTTGPATRPATVPTDRGAAAPDPLELLRRAQTAAELRRIAQAIEMYTAQQRDQWPWLDGNSRPAGTQPATGADELMERLTSSTRAGPIFVEPPAESNVRPAAPTGAGTQPAASGQPQIQIVVDRLRLASLGLSGADALQAVEEATRRGVPPEKLGEVLLKTPNGTRVRLDQVAKLEYAASAPASQPASRPDK